MRRAFLAGLAAVLLAAPAGAQSSPTAAGFTSPVRRLLPGATIASPLGDPVSSAIDVELLDSSGTIVASSWAFHTVQINSSDSPTMRAGLDPAKPVVDGIDWLRIGPTDSPLSVTIVPGQTRARFYVWDTVTGTKTLQAVTVRHDGLTMPTTTQAVVIETGLVSAALTGVFASSLTASWGSQFPAGTVYMVQASTAADYSGAVLSSATLNLFATLTGLDPNSTYYARISAGGVYTSLGSTVTLIESPTALYFEEVSTTSLVVSAYAPTPAFSNLGAGLSGTNIAKDGVYAGWHGEKWTIKAAMPTARYALAAANVNGRVYAMGGWTSFPTTTHQEYDPAGDSWRTRAALPTARLAFGAVVYDGKVYAMGGENTGGRLTLNQAYDPAADSWATKTALPAARAGQGTALLGGKILSFGGLGPSVYAADMNAYDPAADAWSARASLPGINHAMAAAAVSGALYSAGGYDGVTISSNVRYDPGGDSWAYAAPMPTGVNYPGSVVIGRKLYVFGGSAASYVALTQEYDPAADAWTSRAAMPTARSRLAAAAAGGRAYAIGGTNGSGLTVNEEYDPGIAQQFTGLSPNTLYTFKAKARNLQGVETGEATASTYTAAAVPSTATPVFLGVFASSVSLQWSANGNPGGTEYRVQASTASDYNAAASSRSTAWQTTVSAVIPSLASLTTWYFRVQARNAVGAETAYAVLGATVTGPTFQRVVLAGTSGVSPNVAAGDYDADGDVDFLVANEAGVSDKLLRNDAGSLTQVAVNAGGDTWGAAWGDYDGDGDLDACLANINNQDEVVLRNDAGSFTPVTLSGTAGHTHACAWGDYDNDGDLDILLANYFNADEVLMRNDEGTFVKVTLSGTGGDSLDAAWADVDGDGDLDALVTNENSDDFLLRNDGGVFTKVPITGTSTTQTRRVAWVDVDGDGDLDVAVGASNSVPVKLLRNQAGALSYEGIGGAASRSGVAAGDADGDGDFDLLAAGSGLSVFAAHGSTLIPVAMAAPAGSRSAAAWGDYDGDGDLDAVIGGFSSADEELWVNAGGVVNSTPSAPPAPAFHLAYGAASTTFTVTWPAGAYDAETASGLLHYAIVVATAPMTLSADGRRVLSPSSYTVTWNYGTPLFGQYPRPAYKSWPGEAAPRHGLVFRLDAPNVLNAHIKSDTTYYVRVAAIDAGLARSSWSVEASTWVLRAVAPAGRSVSAVWPSSITVSYSTVGASAYLLQASTMADFSGPLLLTSTTDLTRTSLTTTGLDANALYFLRMGALWRTTTVWADAVPASTYTAALVPGSAVPTFLGVFASSVSLQCSANGNPAGTGYRVHASTASDYNAAASSAVTGWTTAVSTTVPQLSANTTWYFRAQARNAAGVETAYASLGSTVTLIESPTALYFDEISSHSLVVAAYAPTPAFSNLGAGLSGTNIAKDGVYAGWHGERWTTKASLPSVRNRMGVAVIAGRVYAFGGLNSVTFTNVHHVYDPVSNAWSSRAVLPSPAREGMSVGVIDGRAHAAGGRDAAGPVANHVVYDPLSDSWSSRAAAPTARYGGAGAVDDGKLFVVGGELVGVTRTALNERYDPASDSWTARSPMPTARYMFALARLDRRFYALGGSDVAELAANESYDPVSDSWTARSPMPTARWFAGAAVIGGKVLVIGGHAGSARLTVNEEYDPAADAWTTRAPMPTARQLRDAAAVVGGRVYAIGGWDSVYLTTNEEYDPGIAQQFTGLSPNTLYTFKAKARNLQGVETGEVAASTYSGAAAPSGLAFAMVGSSSMTLQWALNGNPALTEFQAALSTSPVFAGASAGPWAAGAASATFTGLAEYTTYYARVRARNFAGLPTDWTEASARTLVAPPPGCASAFFVSQDGGAGCSSIQACVDLIPASPLSGDACVVVVDAAAYDHFAVRGKAPNGNRIIIGSFDAARRPSVRLGGPVSLPVIAVQNASVTLQNLMVVEPDPYQGIVVSSSNVLLQDIHVAMGAGAVQNHAAVVLSSWTTVVRTSVTVSAASGLRSVLGFKVSGIGSSISFSTAVGSGADAFSTLELRDASSNTVSDSYFYNSNCYGVTAARADYNTVARSTAVGSRAGCAGLHVFGGTGNVFDGLYIEGRGTSGAGFDDFEGPNVGNAVKRSTVAGGETFYPALRFSGVSSAALEDSWVHASTWDAVSIDGGGASITRSTLAAAAPGRAALSITAAPDPSTPRIILGSYLQASTAAALAGTGYVTFSGSELVATDALGDGLRASGSLGVSIDSTRLRGGSGAAGLSFAGHSGTLAISSSVVSGAGVGLRLSTPSLAPILVVAALDFSALAPGATAVEFLGGPFVSTFSGASFDASVAVNVDGRRLGALSSVTMRDASGARAGPAFERDPDRVVHWAGTAYAPPSSAPVLSGAALGTSSIAWNWAAAIGAWRYDLYSASSGTVLARVSTPGFTQEGLSPNTPYGAALAAVAADESAVLSAAATVYTAATPPAGLAAAVSGSSAVLTWSLNGNPAGTVAELQRSTDGAAFATRLLAPATVFADQNLLGCTTYHYRARNRNGDGLLTAFDGPITFVTLASTPLPPGQFSAASLEGRRIQLDWTASPTEGIVAYRLYASTPGAAVDYSSPYAVFGPAERSTTTPALVSAGVYTFGLRALHRCGVEEGNVSVRASATALESISGVRAVIKVPQTGKKVSGNRVLIMAELASGDPAQTRSVRFQYRASTAAVWTDVPAANAEHPNPDLDHPYFVHWDVTALANGDYDLRAVATDVFGSSDPAPGAVSVTVDAVDFEVRETDLGGGKVKKEQKVHGGADNTVAAAEAGSDVVTKVMLPAGAITDSTATLTVTMNPPATPPPPADAQPVGAALEVTLSNGQEQLSGGQTAALVFNYPDGDGDGVVDGTTLRAENLELRTFHAPSQTWRKEFDAVVDKQARTVTGQTPHFSFFALFGTLATTLDGVRVYPNPWKPNGGNADEGKPYSPSDSTSGVVFDNLPTSVRITIYSLTGTEVAGFGTDSGTGALQWDGRNSSGQDVASGGYFAVITSPGQSPVVKKIGVIR